MCIPKRYGEGPQERPETIYWHRKYLALTFCVLCLILVLKGYSIPIDSIRGIDLFIPPDSLMGGYNITGHRRNNCSCSCFVDVYRINDIDPVACRLWLLDSRGQRGSWMP